MIKNMFYKATSRFFVQGTLIFIVQGTLIFIFIILITGLINKHENQTYTKDDIIQAIILNITDYPNKWKANDHVLYSNKFFNKELQLWMANGEKYIKIDIKKGFGLKNKYTYQPTKKEQSLLWKTAYPLYKKKLDQIFVKHTKSFLGK